MLRIDGATPTTLAVPVFLLPALTCPAAQAMGLTALTPRTANMPSASSGVSVCTVVWAPMPCWPGRMNSRLVPSERICELM